MTDTSFAKVPHRVYDALMRGEITPLQFDILAVQHRTAEHGTGIVRSWSAEVFLHRMGSPDLPSLRTVKRAMQGLRTMGWYRDDYVKGSKRPYNVTMHNFILYGPSHERDIDHENTATDDYESLIINPHEITTCDNETEDDDHENSHGRDRDSDHDVTMTAHGQMSLNNQKSPQPAASDAACGDAAAARNPSGQNNADGSEAADRLREVIHWVPDSAPKTLSRLLQTFTFQEIVAELKSCMDGQWGVADTKAIAAKFAKGGGELEAELRRHRKENQVVEGLVDAGVDRETARYTVRTEGAPKVLAALRDNVNKRAAAAKKGKS